MAKNKADIKQLIRDIKFDLDLIQKIDCSKEENKKYGQLIKEGGELPEGIYRYKMANGEYMDEFYTIYEPELTEEEKREYILLRQYLHIKTIKNCCLFFTALTVISLIIYFLVLCSL